METSADANMTSISKTQHLVEGCYESCVVTPEDFWPSSDMRARFSADVWPEYIDPTQEDEPSSGPSKFVLMIVDANG